MHNTQASAQRAQIFHFSHLCLFVFLWKKISRKAPTNTTYIPENTMVEYTLWDTCVNLEIPKDVFVTDEEIQEMDGHFDFPCEHGYFSSTHQNQKLHYRKWTPPAGTQIKGVLVWQHGIHGEGAMSCKIDGKTYQTAVLVNMAIKAGYIMYSLDMLGHGFSEGVRFLIPDSDWTINRDDLASFAMFVSKQEVEKSSKNLPLFLGGESYGSCLSIHVARKWMDGSKEEKPLNFKGICILAPGACSNFIYSFYIIHFQFFTEFFSLSIAIIGDVPSASVVTFLTSLAYIFPTRTPFFMPHPISPDRIWKNEKVIQEFTSPRHKDRLLSGGGKPFRLGTALGLLRALERVRDTAIPGLNVPFFVAHGTHDFGVPIAGTEYLVQHSSTPEEDKCVLVIDGGYHCLLAEDDREETAGAVIDWMNKRI